MQEMYEDASQVATDAVGSIRTAASFCAEKRVVTTYNEKCEALRKQGIRSGIVGGLGYGFSFLIVFHVWPLFLCWCTVCTSRKNYIPRCF
jgi:hypothetical protein